MHNDSEKRLNVLVLFLQHLLLQQVYDLETSELIHIINATDPINGDWTRYVNCARYLEEQNLVSVQEGTQVFYKAIRVSVQCNVRISSQFYTRAYHQGEILSSVM